MYSKTRARRVSERATLLPTRQTNAVHVQTVFVLLGLSMGASSKGEALGSSLCEEEEEEEEKEEKEEKEEEEEEEEDPFTCRGVRI